MASGTVSRSIEVGGGEVVDRWERQHLVTDPHEIDSVRPGDATERGYGWSGSPGRTSAHGPGLAVLLPLDQATGLEVLVVVQDGPVVEHGVVVDRAGGVLGQVDDERSRQLGVEVLLPEPRGVAHGRQPAAQPAGVAADARAASFPLRPTGRGSWTG